MSIICYRNEAGELIAHRNPTKEQWDAMWFDFTKQNSTSLTEQAIEAYRQSSVLLRYLCA
ncbi:hypothetical protein [Bradyrhizobium betae]|uniref:Uncharacterized protein n=1 Tax=Bradyrhizobium betae TaxID=244734 RepID=A0A5P6P171_9BRAD|nr:hypothetical protein [Bradyrhizobium betae]MCS3725487.1 hypothetical protein [Bradyrhizobium betae]QFI71223.1 hypothetical protein F8237_01835 [Bradyrhizobium betae]